MSRLNSKAQILTALQTITWTNPASVLASDNLAYFSGKTSLGRIDTQQSLEEIPMDQFPYCRVRIPDVDEHRKTDGGDLTSYKDRRFEFHLFLYMAGFAKDWQALGDYFDNMFDAITRYFRRHSSPQPGVVTPADNDHIVGWGLHIRERTDDPDRFGDAVSHKGTILISTIEYVT